MSATIEETTTLVLTVRQVVDGDALCACGQPAVLFVHTEPDNLPGFACYAHAYQWIAISVEFVDLIYGPKGA